ncbi:MAG: amidohydrolase [Planctomycetota bacterium]
MPVPTIDAVYLSGNVYTVDAARPRAEAFAVSGGAFVAVGSDADIRPLVGDGTEVVELGGRTVVPGFIDAHGHVYGLGQLEVGVIDLSVASSYEEVIELVSARAAGTPEGQWIIGRGWDNESWPDTYLPEHSALSEATPDHPVYLQRVDGHACLANEAAMAAGRVGDATVSPDGGEIIRSGEGEPTGVFIDNAERLITRAIPASAQPNAKDTILAAQRLLFEEGVTGVHDMGTQELMLANFRLLARNDLLKLRISCYLSQRFGPRHFGKKPPVRTDSISVLGVKVYLDGAMGSRGAWLLEPYADRPTDDEGNPYTGLAVTDEEYLGSLVGQAIAKRYQIAAHAIGDRANREVLDLYRRGALAARGRELRWRVEHAQLLHPDDIGLFIEHGVIASMQPTHCTSDLRWVEDRVGSGRVGGAYAWASLLRTGAVIASGTDFPVESHDPMTTLYAAVTRQTREGSPEGGWYPEQRMTRPEALRSMTLDAAHAGQAEHRVGSIEAGKLADFVVMDTDIMTCDAADILGAEVVRTVLGGETVYEQ